MERISADSAPLVQDGPVYHGDVIPSRNDENHEMRCSGCAYDLRGLAEHRCPECGRAFDPANARTFLQQPVRVRRLLILAIASVPMTVWPFVAIRLSWTEGIPIWLVPLGPISIICGFTIAWEAARRSINILRGLHPWVEHRWAVLPTAIIGITLVVAFLLGTFGRVLARLLIN